MGFGLDDLWLVQRLKTEGLLSDPVAVAEIGAQQVNKSITASDGNHALAGAPMTRAI
jgi:hypothetical protein